MKASGWLLVAVLTLIVAPSALAQTPTRRVATIDALRRFPGYFHLQNVLVRGEFVESGQRVQLRADERLLDVMLASGVRTTNGPVEVRGQLIDVGRLEPGDARLAGAPGTRDPERWPRPGEELLLNATAVRSVEGPSPVTVRGLALEPWTYEGQTVTLVGQFRGRNLFGDLPGAPAKSQYDFVLRSGDGAVWVTGLRPRGRGFDLNVDARVDTGRWLEVTGVVKRERSLVTIEAVRLTATTARTEAVVAEDQAPPPPPSSPVEVVFSSPTDNETDVPTGTAVRIQFSRGLNLASIQAGLSIGYVTGDTVTPVEFRASYDVATRAVEIKFPQPLNPLSTLRVETKSTLKGFDGASVTPWALTFTIGG